MARNTIQYLNAKEVFPSELLETLYEYNVDGAYVYIPSRKRLKREQKYAYIYYLRSEECLAIQAIADKVHLSVRRIQQILNYYSERYPEQA